MESNQIMNETQKQPSDLGKDVIFRDKPKKNMGVVLGMVFLVLLAVGGVGFGIWAMMNKPSDQGEVHECEECVNADLTNPVTTKFEIDVSLLQNLINPYTSSLGGSTNTIFVYGLNDDVKAAISYYNLAPRDAYDFREGEEVSYYDLNDKYKELFGDENELPERSFSPGHSVSLEYLEDGRFVVQRFMGGGAGGSVVIMAQSGEYNDGELVVNVYYDVVPWCDLLIKDKGEEEAGDYCIDNGKETITDFVNRKKEEIPVSKMIFAENNGHYVLRSIEKNQTLEDWK